MELLPSIDLQNGRVVRLYQGAFDAQTLYPLSPAALYARYAAAGAVRLHVVDLDGAREGVSANGAVLRSLAQLGRLLIQAGGGVRKVADIERLFADGIERVVAGSVAAERPAEFGEWIRRFGADRVVAALDVRIDAEGLPRVASRGWQCTTEASLWDSVAALEKLGLRHVLCTDIARDGAGQGPNVRLYRECVARFPGLSWQASGGIRDAADLHALAAAGVATAISGKALIEGRIPAQELTPFLPAA
jgi:phosphoribosylformimino-5-aminoimidazole carboxamide ribotide isomerase